MSFKFALFVVSSAVLLSGILANNELGKSTEADKDTVGQDLAQSVKVVQHGLSVNFNFAKVSRARKFLKSCKHVKDSIGSAGVDNSQGLSAQITALLAEPRVAQACKIEVEQIRKFDALDHIDMYAYMSAKKVSAVKALGRTLELKPELKIILSNVYEHSKRRMARQILAHAAKDTDIFFGELNQRPGILIDYMHGCEISKLASICQFARSTDKLKAKVRAANFADIKAAIDSGDQNKLNSHALASGVSLTDLKKACVSIKPDLYPIRMVDRYIKANMLSEQQVLDRCEKHPRFDFYYQLNKLCSTLK